MQLYQYWEVVERNGKFCVQHHYYKESYYFNTREFADLHCSFCNRVDQIKYARQPLGLTSTLSGVKLNYGTSYRFYLTINRHPDFKVFVNEKPSPFVRFFQKHILGIEYFPV